MELQLVKNALKDITKILQDQIVAKFVLHKNGLMQEQQAATTVLRDINAPETVQKLNVLQERMQGRVLHLVKIVPQANIKIKKLQAHAKIVKQASGLVQELHLVQSTVPQDINAREMQQKLNAPQEHMLLKVQAHAKIVK